jgi:hypothetical protein
MLICTLSIGRIDFPAPAPSAPLPSVDVAGDRALELLDQDRDVGPARIVLAFRFHRALRCPSALFSIVMLLTTLAPPPGADAHALEIDRRRDRAAVGQRDVSLRPAALAEHAPLAASARRRRRRSG